MVERSAIIRISDPAMEWHEIDLNELRACCKRELAYREYVYPRRVVEGTLKEAKAERELDLMRQVVDFLTHCVFKAVTRRSPA